MQDTYRTYVSFTGMVVTKEDIVPVASFYPVLCTNDVAGTARFYIEHFGFDVTFQSDWYVSLRLPEPTPFELAVVDAQHSTVPKPFRRPVQGLILNFEVEDADAVHERLVVQEKLPVHLGLRDEVFGQRHYIISDPNGVLVDVITVIPPSSEYAEAYVASES